jgi:CheY-like chemotaxis protein
MRDSCRVLIVDDNEPLAENLLEILEDEGMKGQICTNGEEALSRLREDSEFDLVITDFRMPGMTGLALLRHIKDAWPHVPVILLSAYLAGDSAESARSAGALDVMRKPEDLLRLIERARSIDSARQAPIGP